MQIPGRLLRIALPLVDLLFGHVSDRLSLALAYRWAADYPQSATLAFTAAGNNFELAIAVAISVFGIESGEAFATVRVGPLVEVHMGIGLVQWRLAWRERDSAQPPATAGARV